MLNFLFVNKLWNASVLLFWLHMRTNEDVMCFCVITFITKYVNRFSRTLFKLNFLFLLWVVKGKPGHFLATIQNFPKEENDSTIYNKSSRVLFKISKNFRGRLCQSPLISFLNLRNHYISICFVYKAPVRQSRWKCWIIPVQQNEFDSPFAHCVITSLRLYMCGLVLPLARISQHNNKQSSLFVCHLK